MKQFPALNFPQYRFRIARKEGFPIRIWDELRSRWLVLTPEEWVRRHLCKYILSQGVPAAYIVQEYPVEITGMPQRADMVVVGKGGSPLLLAECKSADVGIDKTVYAQAVRYNAVAGARYIMLTNGLNHYIFISNGSGDYNRCEEFPDLSGSF